MARAAKQTPIPADETPVAEAVEQAVTSEVTPEPVPEVRVTINLDPAPEAEPPLSAQTLAEIEAGRASLRRYQGQ